MLNKVSLASLGAASLALGTPATKRDDTQPVGTNPISVASAQFLGDQTSSNSCAGRDLGFTGELNGQWYGVYGDTDWCAPGVTDPSQNPSGFYGLARDTVALMGSNPLSIMDYHLNSDSPVPHPQQFVPYNSDWGENNEFGFGGTSICQTTDTAGAVYYLVNTNENVLWGAGVAQVEIVNNEPTVTRRYGTTGWWWNATTNARYGDVAAYRDINLDYIYIWGGAPTMYDSDYTASQYSYLARVEAANAYDLGSYEYWWGRTSAANGGGWQSDVLTTFSDDTAVFWGVGQGQIVWSAYYNCYIFVHLSGTNVQLRTATTIEGPWTPDITVFTATAINNGYVYAGVAHPYLDTSGKTLTISFSNDASVIQVVKLTFN
ncbi:hypothetical protein F5Y16DRAFT_327639 [Xylariaceae sp. FL0255]|nr:hypothetical protein F5Y16DRAFT_327639 [Xylariaceae sp. FL0255]